MPAFDQFRIANFTRFGNRLLQVLLVLTLLAGVNFLAMKHYQRVDLSQRHLYALSPETKAYLRALESPVQVTVVASGQAQQDDDPLYEYLRNLLREYEEASRQGPHAIRVEYVNLFQDLQRAEELRQRNGLQSVVDGTILVVSEQRQRVIQPGELAEFNGDGQPSAYKGEQALTSAVLEVTAPRQPTIFFTSGHEEMQLDDVTPNRGLSVVATELKARNFALGTLDLTQVDDVPEGTDLVVIAGPRGPFSRAEQEKLRRYLDDRAGRVVLLLGPGRESGLEDLLANWGIRTDDMLVWEESRDFLVDSGSFLIRQFAEHPITQSNLRNETYVVAGLCRPARASGQSLADDRLTVTNLLASSSTSWGERAYRAGGAPRFDAGVDMPGPVPLGVAAERKTASELQINLPGGRFVVFGCGELFANQRVTASGNQTLLLQTINWSLSRDQFLSIPPRPADTFQLNASRGELQQLTLLFLIVPASLGVLGLAILWLRRF